MIKALIVGYGSIGKRHHKILSKMSIIDEVRIFTSQRNLGKNFFNTIEESLDFNPDYIIICSETQDHLSQFTYLKENYKKDCKILIEKPIFSKNPISNLTDSNTYVGYNLRFHPFLKILKAKIKDKNILSVDCVCNTFLPNWRKDISYENSYSAFSSRGGGVILDLSHELDYLNWIFGDHKIEYVRNGKISNLDVKSEDSMLFSGYLKDKIPLEISLKYYSLFERRYLQVEMEEESIGIDLIENKLILKNKKNIKEEALKSFDINKTYLDQHLDILTNDGVNACSMREGLKILIQIEKLKKWKQN